MKTLLILLLALCLSPRLLAADTHNYPTLDRVIYVNECMRAHPGPEFEMQSKCACALDQLATQFSHTEFITLSTAAKATSIGGERGGVLRDNEGAQAQAKRFRAQDLAAKRHCFINIPLPP